MEHTTTDYIFVLSLYNDAIPLSKLLFHLEPGGQAGHNAYLQAKADLRMLEKKKLVVLSKQTGTDYVRLTSLGRKASDTVASALADKMVIEWQYKTLSFQQPQSQPA